MKFILNSDKCFYAPWSDLYEIGKESQFINWLLFLLWFMNNKRYVTVFSKLYESRQKQHTYHVKHENQRDKWTYMDVKGFLLLMLWDSENLKSSEPFAIFLQNSTVIDDPLLIRKLQKHLAKIQVHIFKWNCDIR